MNIVVRLPKVLPLLLFAGLGNFAAVGASFAQLVEDKPDGIQGVGIDDKRGAEIPLNLKFRDSKGKVIKLSEIFTGNRPVLLSLNYSNCPMLCQVQLNGLVEGLKGMEWTAGQQFDVVSVSIDPNESPEKAALTKKKYVEDYGRPGGAAGWRFLTGPEENIRKLADTVGFRYKYVAERQEYAHTASVIVCSPEGVVNRYLNGVMFDPQTVRLSLVEAGEGKIGSKFDQLLLFCFHYDESSGRYGPMARRLMAAGGAATVLALGLALIPVWLRKPDAAMASPSGAATNESNNSDQGYEAEH